MTTEHKFNCIFCKDVFDSKEELQVHFRMHGDPMFKSRNRHGNYSIVSKKSDKNKLEMVSCDVCSEKFPTISKAITHKHKVHPDHDVKYFCPWCGKLFTMKHPYNVHLQTSHEKEEQADDKIFHCDCCDVDFFLTSAMMYHNKFFHRQDTDIPDIGSSKKMKMFPNQETIPIHYCAFCGEEYENKVNLYKHLSDDHSDENQSPEEVLRCPLCEAIFYHLDAYEIHLSFHTTTDLYSGSNEIIAQVTDFSLETVPPMIEKVEREEFDIVAQSQDTDLESSINTVGIENFLELAMGASEDSNHGKTKKKKHKKSKKPAITLDEFLSMNQDVFGEDLDFHGVEEVPTRVVKKQFKNSKKAFNSVTSAELEKLKSKGIVVMKVGVSKPTKSALKKVASKAPPSRELKTSSELLTKLMNQSNKEIKIVKKSGPNKNKNDSVQEVLDKVNVTSSANEESYIQNTIDNTLDINDGVQKTIRDKTGNQNTNLDYSVTRGDLRSPAPNTEECSSTTNSLNMQSNITLDKSGSLPHNGDDNDDEMNITSTNTANINDCSEQTPDIDDISKNVNSKNVESSNTNDYQTSSNLSAAESDSEITEKDKDPHISNVESSDVGDTNNKNSNNRLSPLVSSLSTLQYLSHITVKPVNQNKSASLDLKSKDRPDLHEEKPQAEAEAEPPPLKFVEQHTNNFTAKMVIGKDSTLDALKILGKNITIKSLSTTKKSTSESGSDDDNETYTVMENPTDAMKMKDVSENKNVFTKVSVEPASTNKSANSITSLRMPQVLKKCASETKPPNNSVNSPHSNVPETSTDILKRLPNVVSKTVTMKNLQPQLIKQGNVSIKTAEIKHKEQEVIEISDIDESDDETEGSFMQSDAKQHVNVNSFKKFNKHINALKTLSPSSNFVQNIKVEATHRDDGNEHDNLINLAPTNVKFCSQKLSSKNIAFKNALKNLGKNITVKSQNSSPSQVGKLQDSISQDTATNDDHEFDSETEIGKVRITEIVDQNNSPDEQFYNDDPFDEGPNANDPIIESPHESDNELDEKSEKEFDIESDIKVSMVQKNNPEINTDRNVVCLNNLLNMSKNITIKSLHPKPADKKGKSSLSQESLEVANCQPKQTSTQLCKQAVQEPSNENICDDRSTKTVGKDQNSTDSLDQKVSVNKEVTVKTFQTKTVIQEITTTVTKTVKTVNQTVKQETRNSGQVNIPVLPQKVQGMKPSTSKNLQGVVIRHAAPVNTKPNTTVAQIRPSGTVVRPSKQIVPMRPCLNTRPNTPRMPRVKSSLPNSSPNKPVMGRPLKFSPSALACNFGKRSNNETTSGPFSCFKKPKESLIPGPDIPTFSSEDSVQVNTASYASTSNYMTTSKMMKGSSVTTATHMKSEVTSVQFSKSSNIPGIKIKNAQSQQSQVVQQKSESNTMKRTTLEAIEKLQKQGLLIKKPRIEDNDNSDSDHADDNIDYSSMDEHYE